jgi:hypothetical protein
MTRRVGTNADAESVRVKCVGCDASIEADGAADDVVSECVRLMVNVRLEVETAPVATVVTSRFECPHAEHARNKPAFPPSPAAPQDQ